MSLKRREEMTLELSKFTVNILFRKINLRNQHGVEVGGPGVPLSLIHNSKLKAEDLEFQESGLQNDRNISQGPCNNLVGHRGMIINWER